MLQADRSGPAAWPWEGVCPSLSPSVLEWGGFDSWRSQVHVSHYAGCLCTSRGHSGTVSPCFQRSLRRWGCLLWALIMYGLTYSHFRRHVAKSVGTLQ